MDARTPSPIRASSTGAWLGLFTFLLLFDWRRLDPTNVDWQLRGDPAQHYLGWQYFRYESWHFPLGKIVGYGTPEGSSIVFTDSIPLLAVIFKLLRGALSEPFQYVGLWLLSCYVLQGCFAWLLAQLVSNRWYPKLLMTGFFLLSPILIFRCDDGHHALMAHWIVLAAIYLSVQSAAQFETRHPRWSWTRSWVALVLLSATIHLYFTAMVLPLFLAAYLAHGRIAFEQRRWRAIGVPLSTVAALTTLLYVEGAFVVRPAHWVERTSGEFGRYSMNLLSPLSPGFWQNPDDASYMSLFLGSHRHLTDGQYEGFNYLGLGCLLLLATVTGMLVWVAVQYQRGAWTSGSSCPPTRLSLPVVVTLVLLALFSLSHRIAMDNHLLIQIPLSESVLERFQIFRASGRFFWPCYYTILWLGFRALTWVTRHRLQLFAAVLHAALTVQAVDLSPIHQRFAKRNREVTRYRSALAHPSWRQYVKKYEAIEYYPPSDNKLYVPLGLMAAPRGVGINVSYKARHDPAVLSQGESRIRRELESGELRSRTMYVFESATLFEGLKKLNDEQKYLLDQLDGYYIAARRDSASTRGSGDAEQPAGPRTLASWLGS